MNTGVESCNQAKKSPKNLAGCLLFVRRPILQLALLVAGSTTGLSIHIIEVGVRTRTHRSLSPSLSPRSSTEQHPSIHPSYYNNKQPSPSSRISRGGRLCLTEYCCHSTPSFFLNTFCARKYFHSTQLTSLHNPDRLPTLFRVVYEPPRNGRKNFLIRKNFVQNQNQSDGDPLTAIEDVDNFRSRL